MNDNNIDHLKKFYRIKAIIIFALAGLSVIVFACLLFLDLRVDVRQKQEQNNSRFFSSTLRSLDRNVDEVNALLKSYHDNNKIMLGDLVMAYSNNNFSELMSLTLDEQIQVLSEATGNMSDCIWLLVVNDKGNVIVSDIKDWVGLTVIDPDVLTEEEFQELCDRKKDYIIKDNPYYGEDGDTGKKMYLYCQRIPGAGDREGDKYFLLSFSSSIIDTVEDALLDLSPWLNGSIMGNSGKVFVVDASSDTLVYGSFDDDDKTSGSASDMGLTPEILTDRYTGTAEINGSKCYVSVRAYSSELYGNDNYIVSAVPLRNMYGMNMSVIIWSICLFIIFTVLVISYSSIVRFEIMKNGEELKKVRLIKAGNAEIFWSNTLAVKIIPVVLTVLVIALGFAFYQQILMKLSDCFADTVSTEEEVMSNMEKNADLIDDFSEYHDMQYINRAKLISFIVSLDADEYLDLSETSGVLSQYGRYDGKDRRDVVKDEYNNVVYVLNDSKALRTLSEHNSVNDIYLISDTGVTLATSSGYWNFSLSTDPADQSYEFWDIIFGKRDSLVQDPRVNDAGDMTSFVGCPLYYYTCLDEDRNTKYVSYVDYMHQNDSSYKGNEITRHRGLLQIETGAGDYQGEIILDIDKPEYVLANTKVSNDGFLAAFKYDDEEGDYKVFYSQNDSLQNEYASDLEISDKAFSGNYNGFQRYGSEWYLQSFRETGDYYLATIMPIDSLILSSIESVRSCAFCSVAIMLIICLFMILVRNEGEEKLYREADDPFEMLFFSEKARKWRKHTSSHKLETIVKHSFIVLGIMFLISIIMESQNSGSNSTILYILSGEWDRGVHIFSISACVVTVIATLIFLKIFGDVTYLIAEAFGKRVVTMMRLFVSLVKTLVVVLMILYCLYLMGIDGTRLLASAGIMSVVVGLGAQSLVGDLLAGIFIILEGSLHVGDYVLIDGVRGKIIEIGLRITRYEDDNQNIRVICNNELKSFANMSEKYSVVYYNIPVPYNADYMKIRRILNEEFLKLYEEHRFLKSIPSCMGIEEFSESSVDMRVRFMCEEGERYTVQRFMHDQIMRIFMENGISIPFNQLDIHFDREFIGKD